MKLIKKNGQCFLPGFTEYDNLKTYENPKDDNERFCNLQKRYLIDHDDSAFIEMWELVTALCGKALHLECKKTGFIFSRSDFKAKVEDCTIFLLSRFKTYYGYTFDKIVTQARFAVIHELYINCDAEMVETIAVDLMNKKVCQTMEGALQMAGLIIEKRKGEALPKKEKEDEKQLYFTFA